MKIIGIQAQKQTGFTLIEVLIALAVVAIALTALLKATSQDVASTQHIKDKTISHWIAMKGVSMIQLNLVNVPYNQVITEVTTLFGQRWYWQARLSPTKIKNMDKIVITVSKNQSGPFTSPLTAFRVKS